MTQATLKMALGNWVVGDRFWGRETDLELFISWIDAGAHQQLTAQRRMGKTSLMHETARRLQDRYQCIFVDLQKASAAPDAIVELSLAMRDHKSLWQKVTGVFSHALSQFRDNVENINLGEFGISLRAGLSGDWQQKGDQLMAVLAEADLPVLLLIDEVPILINRMLKGDDYRITPERRSNADVFLSWLRNNSLQHQGKIRLVLSGSIGLGPILRQGRLSATLNNFELFELKPWDDATAIGCLEALAAEYNIELGDGVAATMIDLLGCSIPHHVQMFFRYAYDLSVRQKQTRISQSDVERIYQREMLSTRGHAELTHYEERLKMVLGDDLFPMALELLTETAVVGALTADAMRIIAAKHDIESLSVGEAERQILEVLEHDGYIEQRSDRYEYISKLLRDWWKSRHGFGYIPASEQGV